jgi:hypothetical protein
MSIRVEIIEVIRRKDGDIATVEFPAFGDGTPQRVTIKGSDDDLGALAPGSKFSVALVPFVEPDHPAANVPNGRIAADAPLVPVDHPAVLDPSDASTCEPAAPQPADASTCEPDNPGPTGETQEQAPPDGDDDAA